MGRQADPLHVEQGVGRLGYGFGGKHVQPRPPDNAPVQRVDQLLLADHVAPGGVDQDGAVLHHLKLPPPDGTPGLRRGGDVEGDDVRVPEEAVHALRPLNTVRQPPRAGSRKRTGTCSATKYASPSFPGRSRRRMPTVSAMSWLCGGRREGTSSSSPPTRTRPISITTFITIPPPLTAPINTGISSVPVVPSGGCPTPSVWKMASLW